MMLYVLPWYYMYHLKRFYKYCDMILVKQCFFFSFCYLKYMYFGEHCTFNIFSVPRCYHEIICKYLFNGVPFSMLFPINTRKMKIIYKNSYLVSRHVFQFSVSLFRSKDKGCWCLDDLNTGAIFCCDDNSRNKPL